MSEQRIVEMAIMAAGTADAGWEKRVTALVPKVASMFREPRDDEDPTSPMVNARKVVEAKSFKAEYRSHEYDDKTQRVFVKIFDPDASGDNLDDDGCQTVRTEPMWSATGRTVREILKTMSSGQQAVFYRYTEPIEGGKKKMGVLVHLEPRRQRNASAEPARTSSSGPVGGGSQAPPEEPRTPSGGAEFNEAIHARFEALGNRQKVAFMHLCRNASPPIANGLAPEPDELDRALLFMSEIEKEA